MFSKLYAQTLVWAKHRHASKYLFCLSFAEASFFPIPPDIMLAPMVLARPSKALQLAFITTISSVLGGVLGYAIGYFAFDVIAIWLQESHYWEQYQQTNIWFENWGFWAVFLAGFSPIPYKVFTVAAGALNMLLLPFVLASVIGRGTRFFLVALLLSLGGKTFAGILHTYIDFIGWGVVVLITGGLAYKFGVFM